MPKLTYAEHPVHPVINDYPAALVPTSLVFDMLHLVTRRSSFKVASFFTMVLALITGGAAAATGYADYREIPADTEEKRVANAHALLNAGVMASLVVQLLIRATGRVGLFARLLNIVANVGMFSASWYGTHLVYRHGVRVDGTPGSPVDAAMVGAADADRGSIADVLEGALGVVPATDLSEIVEKVVGSVQRATDTLTDRASDSADEWSDQLPEPDEHGALGDPVAEGETDVTAAVNEALEDQPAR
jgi:uncharacterized membrane protein